MNNKKITIIFILISFAILIGIGITFAYFTSSTDFENEFQTGLFQTEATEVFTSPENWKPGDTTPKTLTVTNTGNVDVKARVCISEEWESDNGDSLPLEQNGERVAILNLANTSDWTYRLGCYEYNDTLEPNDETSSFIESVTFNPNVEADIECTTSGNTKTCTSSGDGYDNATYTLTLRVETIQENAYEELWPSEVVAYTSDLIGYTIGEALPSGMNTYNNLEEFIQLYPTIYNYLKLISEDDIVKESYVEFRVTEAMVQSNSGMTAGIYDLRGGTATYNENTSSYNDDSPYYEVNKSILLSAFGLGKCNDWTTLYLCNSYSINATVYPDGRVSVNNNTTGYYCYISQNGHSNCGS